MFVGAIDVLADGLRFPEGPAFDPAGRLWFAELNNHCVSRLEADGSVRRFVTGGVPAGLAISADSEIFVTDKKRGLLRLDGETGRFETLATAVDGVELADPNDLCFDPFGDILFGCPRGSFGEPIGYVCRWRRDGSIGKVAEGLRFPNGMKFDRAGRRVFVAETGRQRILVGDYRRDGRLELRPFAYVGGSAGPDGLALDASERIFVAVFGSSHLAVVDGGGVVTQRIAVTGARPTSCAFDPSGRLGLVVTEAELGRLLSIRPATAGLPLPDGRPVR